VLLGASGLLVGRRLVRPVHALELLAFQDPLTGLATRRFFIAWLMQTLELARRYQQPLSLIFLDLDNFKQVNDRYGHLVGDRVLQEVAARVRSGLRASDLVVRYGGEEIVAALPQTGKEAALHVADTLRRAIADSPVAWDTNGEPVTITVSAGVASVPDDASDAHSLLERTDAALYLAKAQGRDRVVPA
jgi:diguanylate cyclase (GGDEF)-like protein